MCIYIYIISYIYIYIFYLYIYINISYIDVHIPLTVGMFHLQQRFNGAKPQLPGDFHSDSAWPLGR